METSPPITIHSIYVGQPKTITDEQGTWRSSIYRTRLDGPARVEVRGLAGDQVAQPDHGSPDSAICCHFLAHYRFWNASYGMHLEPGHVGENWALENADESTLCIGDVYRAGTVRVQVSGTRIPCANQARRIGRADWVKLTLQELRTGLYMRVVQPGAVQAGDALVLEERLNPGVTITALSRCYFHELDPELARRFIHMPGLAGWWKEQFDEKLRLL